MAIFANSSAAGSSLSGVLTAVRLAQKSWADVPVRQRLQFVRRLRHRIAGRADRLAALIARPIAETLTSEVLPLAEACRFLERNAGQLLAPRRIRRGGPLWLRSVNLEIRREPFGVVLIVGPANYPLFLPGVQMVQALAAGNGVLLKPGVSGSLVASMLVECARDAGLPDDLVVLLDETTASVNEAIAVGVDKVIVTGSHLTGQTILASLAEHVTPAVTELSGWDPVFILPGADIHRAAAAIAFGVKLNRGATCIRPRVVYAAPETIARVREELGPGAGELELVPVMSHHEALRKAAECEYALGAAVFGPAGDAQALAQQIRAGVVVINDIIVPTAHPALPFGGRGASGFGVTRGAEGLLELTTVKAIAVQTARWPPHLKQPMPGDERLFSAFIRTLHGAGITQRLHACAELWRAILQRRKEINADAIR